VSGRFIFIATNRLTSRPGSGSACSAGIARTPRFPRSSRVGRLRRGAALTLRAVATSSGFGLPRFPPDGALGSVSAVPIARSPARAVDRRVGRETSPSSDAKR
jgi:hypothetical protein